MSLKPRSSLLLQGSPFALLPKRNSSALDTHDTSPRCLPFCPSLFLTWESEGVTTCLGAEAGRGTVPLDEELMEAVRR